MACVETKYQSVLNSLLNDIRAGKYRETAFPSENMAASRFSVGRKTIGRVYEELARRGLIARRRGAGTVLTRKAIGEFGRIGLIIHGSDYCELFAPIARRMSHLCQQNGLALLFADLSGDAVSRRVDKIAQTAADFVKTGVNGVIFQPVELVKNAEAINRKILATFDEAGVPVVLLDSDIVRSPGRSGYDLAAVNHVEAGRRIGEHLVRCGAKRIAYLMEREHAPCVQDRYLGVRIGADGKMVKWCAVYAKPDNIAAIRKVIKALRPDAFACYNDREARLLISTLAQLGYDVPKDIQVAGFDDVNYATISAPSLTTAHQPCGELADLAFDMLMARIDKPDAPVRETFLDAPLVVRGTTRAKLGRDAHPVRPLCKTACRALAALLSFALPFCGIASDSETNLWRHAAQRLSFNAFADVESAYWARGAIVDKRPYSAQFADLSFNLDPFGRVGGYAWSVSSLAKSGQSATRRNAYNEVDYAVYYGYGLKLAEEWTLDTTVAKKWVTLPGYRPHASTISEWNVSQALKNPYVTPYYLLRRAYNGQKWCYWDVGLTRSWKFLGDFHFTATAFGEFGDSRHFAAQYGANPDGSGRYSDGLMALNLMLRLDYSVTEWLGVFAFVHQFDVVSSDARDALDRDMSPQSRKDMTILGIGMAVNF